MPTKTKATKALRFTLSGPGVDKSYETAGVAMSAAITKADHHDGEGSWYVRDFDGSTVGSVLRDEHGNVFIDRATFIGTKASV